MKSLVSSVYRLSGLAPAMIKADIGSLPDES